MPDPATELREIANDWDLPEGEAGALNRADDEIDRLRANIGEAATLNGRLLSSLDEAERKQKRAREALAILPAWLRPMVLDDLDGFAHGLSVVGIGVSDYGQFGPREAMECHAEAEGALTARQISKAVGKNIRTTRELIRDGIGAGRLEVTWTTPPRIDGTLQRVPAYRLAA